MINNDLRPEACVIRQPAFVERWHCPVMQLLFFKLLYVMQLYPFVGSGGFLTSRSCRFPYVIALFAGATGLGAAISVPQTHAF